MYMRVRVCLLLIPKPHTPTNSACPIGVVGPYKHVVVIELKGWFVRPGKWGVGTP